MRVTKQCPPMSCREMGAKKPREREIQMVILLVIITITFICSWAPLDLLMIKNQIWPQSPNENPILDMRAIRLVSINQIVDPWSYIICRIIFRSKLWSSCRVVLIGRISSRRIGSRNSRGDEPSSFYSMQAPKFKLSTVAKLTKRRSLPEMGFKSSLRRENLRKERNTKPIANSPNSTFDQDCKIDLQSCYSPQHEPKKNTKMSSISFTIAKLFHSPSLTLKSSCKQNSNGDEGNLMSLHNRRHTFTKYDGHKYPRKLFFASYHGKAKRKEENISCVNLAGSDSSNFPLLKGFGSTTTNFSARSNSWCCPDEYTLAYKNKSHLNSQDSKEENDIPDIIIHK